MPGNEGGSATAPAIATQPANQTVTAGQTATFSVTAAGTAPLTYQWQEGRDCNHRCNLGKLHDTGDNNI